MRRTITVAILCSLLVGLPACHTMRFELANADHVNVVYDRKSYLFWGLAPTVEIDVGKLCPAGVAAIKEETTFTDGLLTFPTLGIWGHRSSWYYCLPKPAVIPKGRGRGRVPGVTRLASSFGLGHGDLSGLSAICGEGHAHETQAVQEQARRFGHWRAQIRTPGTVAIPGASSGSGGALWHRRAGPFCSAAARDCAPRGVKPAWE